MEPEFRTNVQTVIRAIARSQETPLHDQDPFYWLTRKVGPIQESWFSFIQTASACSRAIQQEAADLIMQKAVVHFINPNLSLRPLREWLVDVFLLWWSEDDAPGTPNRWLGYLEHDDGHFKMALAKNPHDQQAHQGLVRILVWGISQEIHWCDDLSGLNISLIDQLLFDISDQLKHIEDVDFVSHIRKVLRSFVVVSAKVKLYQIEQRSGDVTDFKAWSEQQTHTDNELAEMWALM